MKTKQKHDDSYYYDIIRNNIKKYRLAEKLTQQDLADKSGLSMNYIAKIESTKMKKTFSIAAIGHIADALEIDIRKLYDGID